MAAIHAAQFIDKVGLSSLVQIKQTVIAALLRRTRRHGRRRHRAKPGAQRDRFDAAYDDLRSGVRLFGFRLVVAGAHAAHSIAAASASGEGDSNPKMKSAAFEASEAALKMARLSSFKTSSQDPR